MTGYTVHTGASKKFVEGWDRVFGDGKPVKKKSAVSNEQKQKKTGGKKTSKRRSG